MFDMGSLVAKPSVASWYVAGGGFGFDVEVAVPGASKNADNGLSAGGGFMQLDVKSRKQSDDVSYRMTFLYLELELGFGESLYGVVSFSIGAPELPATGTPVLRNITAPGDEGADGPPTGFLGPAYTVSVNGGFGIPGEGGFIVMGSPGPIGPMVTPIALPLFKYAAGYGGFGVGTTFGGGVALQAGWIAQIDKYVGGSPTNQRVGRNGLVSGSPFPVPY